MAVCLRKLSTVKTAANAARAMRCCSSAGALLFGFSLVNLLWPKRTQLELENRKAAPFPAFSVSTLLDGSWQSGFSRWMQDQFAFRDAAVNTQRAADEVLFQKVEEGGILLGKDHWMFTKLFTVDDATKKQLDKNITGSQRFCRKSPGQSHLPAGTVGQWSPTPKCSPWAHRW